MTDIIINIKSKKFDGDALIIGGKATTNRRDAHGESITISPRAFADAYKSFDGTVMVEHGMDHNYLNRKVGSVAMMNYEPKEYSIDSPKPLDMRINAVCRIADKEAIQDILDGKLDSFSLRWTTKNWLINQKTKQRIDTEIHIKELTLTGSPANPDATFTVVTDEELAKQYKLGETVKVYDTLANVKSLYTDGSRYYVDVDFVDEIVNVKSANKIPVDAIDKGFIVNVKKKFIVNIKSVKTYSNYPQSASNNAKKALKWREEHGDAVKGGTRVGWTRANQLAKRETLSESTVKRVKSFLARHEKNAEIDPKFKDEPWRDAGHVAYLIWGGKSMKNWVDSLSLE